MARTGRGGRSGRSGSPSNTPDLSTLEGLALKASQTGLAKQAAKITEQKPTLSFLQRLGKGLGALNPAEAILTGKEKGIVAGAIEYPKRVIQSVGSAITGVDYGGTQRGFKEVAQQAGVENKIAQFGIGFLGDVLLDPSTYFGGAIAKGVGAVAKGGGELALKTVGKVAPTTETGLRLAGEGLQDALGKAFKFGYKSSEGAPSDVLKFLSKKQQAQVDLAASNLARLGTGTLSPEQQKELVLKLAAGKRAEFTAREGGQTAEEAVKAAQDAAQSSDPLVQKTIEEQGARSKEFAKIAGIENPYETYFPFLKKDKVEKFVNETRGIQVGSEGYKKQFKNLLTDDAIELDPAKAFFTREAQIISDKETREFLTDFVGKYGKPLDAFANADEAAKAGFQVIREKGIFGKELGYVGEFDAKLLRDGITPEFQSIDMLAKATGYDAMTSLFKRAVTGLFPSFHVRNFVSGMIQNYEVLGVGALNPKNIAAGQKIAYLLAKGEKIPAGKILIAGKPTEFSTVMKPFAERFSGDTFYNADFELALKSGAQLKSLAGTFSKERVAETVKTLGLGQEAIPFKVGRAIGQFIEHQQKATAYITALEQGKSIDDALALAEKAGFDYRALTRFESQIMRRLIPFYSFTRKNIELQLATLGENPQRINQILKFFSNNPLEVIGVNSGGPLTEEEKKDLPAFIRESIGIKLEDTPEGLKQYISGFGTPIEAFAQLFGSNPILRAISQTNPLLKTPIELGIGKDSFRQRDLKDVYSANEYKQAPQFIKDLLEIKEVKKDILKKGADGKLVKVGEKTAYIADPEKLLIARSLFTSRGVSFLDQVFDNDLDAFAKALKTTTGVKVQQVDLEQQKAFNETDKKRALEDLLNRYGVVSKFQKVYEPKQ